MRRMKSQQFPNKEHKKNIHLSPFILNSQSGLMTNYAKSVQDVRLNYGRDTHRERELQFLSLMSLSPFLSDKHLQWEIYIAAL